MDSVSVSVSVAVSDSDSAHQNRNRNRKSTQRSPHTDPQNRAREHEQHEGTPQTSQNGEPDPPRDTRLGTGTGTGTGTGIRLGTRIGPKVGRINRLGLEGPVEREPARLPAGDPPHGAPAAEQPQTKDAAAGTHARPEIKAGINTAHLRIRGSRQGGGGVLRPRQLI